MNHSLTGPWEGSPIRYKQCGNHLYHPQTSLWYHFKKKQQPASCPNQGQQERLTQCCSLRVWFTHWPDQISLQVPKQPSQAEGQCGRNSLHALKHRITPQVSCGLNSFCLWPFFPVLPCWRQAVWLYALPARCPACLYREELSLKEPRAPPSLWSPSFTTGHLPSLPMVF